MAPPKKLAAVKEKRVFKCPHCDKTVADSSSLQRHVEIHNNDYPYSCTVCAYKCKVKKYLARHMKKVHNKANGPHCPVCGKVFHFNSNLKNHMRVHTGEKPYQCPVCNKAFSSGYCLSMHKLIHTDEKPYQCNFCDYACRDNSTLRRHEERHMGILKTFPCKKCKRIFKTNARLKIHVDEAHYGIETRRFSCEQCEKAFKTKTALNLHVRTVHEKLRQTECEICGRSISKNNVHMHLKSHIDVRPYKCRVCPKRFKDQGTLKKHTLIHYPEYHHECSLCGTRFARKVRLREHLRQHEADGGYTCDHCGVSFNKKPCLTNHIRRKHDTNCERFICDECGLVNYSKRAIILHLKYGHGTENERKCKICSSVVESSSILKKHYLKSHNVRYVIQKTDNEIIIKDEPVEVCAEFEFNYVVQKVELDDQHIPDPEYVDSASTLAYSEKVLEEDMSRTLTEVDMVQPETEFDKFFVEQVINKPGRKKSNPDPEYADTETTLAYSEKVLEEDISRSIIERDKNETPESTLDDFFIQQVMNKPRTKELPKSKVNTADKRQLAQAKKKITKMLNESRLKKEAIILEKMRRKYNKRIKMAYESGEKKESTQIKYYKKPESSQNNNTLINDETQENHNQNKNNDNNDKITSQNRVTEEESDVIDDEDDRILDIPLSQRITRKKTKVISYSDENDKNDSDYECTENEGSQKNGKIKFNGHECYICFKLFNTKKDLKHHCLEHFDICNEKMLKKCPFCGYVTNKNMKRHIELVHKININYAYGQILEKNDNNGSKYVFEIDDDCELEIIPSISSLNKIACMKNDEKNRQNKNNFIGTTKLVKKGQQWVVEKKPVNLTNENLLPIFSEEEYQKLKIFGDTYLDRIKKLSHLAKKRGVKMLYPCEGCDKICQTMAALKLHNRKHEDNPKRFRPKVWVNRHIEYKTKNRKRIRCSNKTKKKLKEKKASAKKAVRKLPVRKLPITETPVNENRFASPQPVKNKHKCDKQLIEFYKSNIKGGDIEFWQFLKIFNKMSRENVNDFKDLENRDDLHFGLHIKEQNEPSITDIESVITDHESVSNEKEPVLSKNIGKSRKNGRKAFTRAIMISRQEYIRRNEIKNEMRKRLQENKI